MAVVLHQVAAGAAPRDAITNHLFASQELFRSWGIESEIYATHIEPSLKDDVRPADLYPKEVPASAPVIIHYSIDSPGFPLAVEHSAAPLFHYHNITPAELLWRYAPSIAVECGAGRRRLADYSDAVAGSAADSAYNAGELSEAGFRDPRAVGILRNSVTAQSKGTTRSGDGRLRVLFVGRGVPNKAQHDLIYSLAALLEAGTDAELWLVGVWNTAPLYRRQCERVATELGVENRVEYVDRATHAELSRRYATADVFLCLSDHEGFCVPLLEAMEAGLPIVAFGSSAIPETLGEAGLVLPEKAPSLVAEAVIAATTDPRLQERFAKARQTRLDHFSPDAVAGRMRDFLSPYL